MFALPAEPRRLRQRLFRHRGGIDENLHLGVSRAGLLHQPTRQPFQPFLDDIVVVTPLRID